MVACRVRHESRTACKEVLIYMLYVCTPDYLVHMYEQVEECWTDLKPLLVLLCR